MSPVRPRHLLVLLAAIAILLGTCVALLVREVVDGPNPDYSFPSMTVIGIGLGWGGLGACYLALGRQRLIVRLAMSTAIALAAGAVCAQVESPDSYRVWCGVMLFGNFVIAVPLVYCWARGLRLTHPEHPPIEYWKPRGQFSLWSLLTAITCTAVLLAIAMRLEFPLDSLYAVLVVCGVTAAIPYVAGATLLGRIPPVWPILSIPVTALLAAGALHTLGGPMTLPRELTATVATTAVVGVWMLVLRIAGYQLKWPDYAAMETVGPSKRLVDEHGEPVELTQPLRLHQPPADADGAQSNHSSEQSNLG